MVEVPDRARPYLRRAYSVADVHSAEGAVELLIKTIGHGTAALETMPEGSPVRLLGPLGNAFSFDDLPRGARVAIVAGGIGAAPFPLLLKTLTRAGLTADFYFGGRNAKELSLKSRFDGLVSGETILSTDDGSLGEKGFVTEALSRRIAGGARYARVFACGPMPMFAALARVVAAAGLSVAVLDRGGNGLRLRRVPRVRHPGDREAVHRLVQRGTDSGPEKIAW